MNLTLAASTDTTSVPGRLRVALAGNPNCGKTSLLNALTRTRLRKRAALRLLLKATPCKATVAVTRRESGRGRWALLQLFDLTSIAWRLAFAVVQLGRLVA